MTGFADKIRAFSKSADAPAPFPFSLPNFRSGLICIALSSALAGCVSNTTLPSQNIGTLLTPTNNSAGDKPADSLETKLKQADAAKANEPSSTDASTLAQSAKKTPETATPAKKPESTTSLAAGKQKTSAEKATDTVIKPEASATAKKTEAAKPVQVAKLTQADTGAAKPPVEKSKPLFGGLFSGNTAGSARTNRTTTTRTSTTSRSSVKTIDSNRARRTARRSNSALPGVNLKKALGIETDDLDELDEPVKVASVTNLARRGTHGLLLQHKGVKVGCFPRKLVRLLKQVERRFGRTPIVTSGYRSPSHNRRIRGARKSMHIYCKAADIQVRGVSKWRLAKYLRSLPGRGGVGTYCHTKSVHIDIANKRDWNRRCRRSRKRRG